MCNRLDTISACDGQTDRQTSCDGKVRAMHMRREVKNGPLILRVNFNRLTRFLPRDAMHKRGLCRHAVSVCLCSSVCLSRS